MALTWSCEQFSDYLLRKTFHAQTDHKPLILPLHSKQFHDLPICAQRFKTWLMRHHLSHALLTTDTLSQTSINSYMNNLIKRWLMSVLCVRVYQYTINATIRSESSSKKWCLPTAHNYKVLQRWMALQATHTYVVQRCIPYYFVAIEILFQDCKSQNQPAEPLIPSRLLFYWYVKVMLDIK